MKLNDKMKVIACGGLAIVLCLIGYSCGSNNKNVEEVETKQKQEMQVEEQEELETQEVEEEIIIKTPILEEENEKVEPQITETEEVTFGMRNALGSAESYLDCMGFSKEGLKDQLEYEGYTSEEINYAVENVIVDWNEECVESAESYLDCMSFSRQGLIEQLEYEGFTSEQINYAMERVWR